MENNQNPTSRFPYSIELAASLLCITLIITMLYHLSSVLLPLLFSILIAISLYPLTKKLEKIGLGKAIASMIAVLFAIVFVGFLFWFIIAQVIVIGQDGAAMQEKFLGIFDTIQEWVEAQFGLEPTQVVQYMRDQTDKIVSYAGSSISTTFGSIGSTLASIILVPLFTFFLLYYRVFFREFFFKAFKRTPNEIVNKTLNKIYYVVQSYLLGLVIVMGIVAILNTIGLYILGIEYAWFFGTLASLLMLLPYVGIAIGSILPAVFALATKDSAWYAVGIIGWFQVVQFLEGNVITPNIVGSKVSINPLMAIISILLGGMLFGLAGLILALPFTATLKVIFDSIPGTQAFGFLIGEPEKHHLKRNNAEENLKRWGIWNTLDKTVQKKLRLKGKAKETLPKE